MELIGLLLVVGCVIVSWMLFYNMLGKELIASKCWNKTTATLLDIEIEMFTNSEGENREKRILVWEYYTSENGRKIYRQKGQIDFKSRRKGDVETIYYKGKNALIKTSIIGKFISLFFISVCVVSMIVMGFIFLNAFFVY